MIPNPPSGQGPIDPRNSFSPPPFPAGPYGSGFPSPMGPPPGMPPGAGFGPPLMPPPGYPMVMPPRRGGGFARLIYSTIAVLIFVGSLAMNFILLAVLGTSSTGANTVRTPNVTTLVSGDTSQRIAVISVNGEITSLTAEHFNQKMDAIEKDSTIHALVIEIETPGGGVTPSDQIHHRLERFKKDYQTAHGGTSIPVVVTMGQLATSGGYYIACAGDYIFAEPTTLTGNIGVLMPRYNFSKLAEKYGVQESTVTAPEAGFKNAGSPFTPEKLEDTKYIQGLINQAFTQFKAVVSTGRGSKLKLPSDASASGMQPIDAIANGKVYTAAEALKLGLIDDASGYSDDAYKWAVQKSGLSNPAIVRYEDPPTRLMDLLSASSNLPGAKASSAVNINGVNVNVDVSALDSLTKPRMLYLWRGE